LSGSAQASSVSHGDRRASARLALALALFIFISL